MNNQETFSVEIPVNDPAAMKRFQKFMDEYADAMNNYIAETATKLGVSEGCASDIIYLRGRSRWTQAAEDELVRRNKAGEPAPNIMEWP